MRLPPGQREIAALPRFGLLPFADRIPHGSGPPALEVRGAVGYPVTLAAELERLQRVERVADLHCVTTWTVRALRWGGFLFRDVYAFVTQTAAPAADANLVVLRGADGYSTSLPLADLLADDVVLVDRLNGEPLPLAHGAPLRLIAPAHYGYKSVKHLRAIEFRRGTGYRSRAFPFRFMDHPRARVEREERGRWVPGWVLRFLYRPLVRPTVRAFEQALERHGRRRAEGGL